MRKALLTCAMLLFGGAAHAQAGAGTYEALADFGENPGALLAYRYSPPNAPDNAPLVLALHACAQDAATYRAAGWEPLADELGFYVLYPEQTNANNGAGCFNWAGEFGDGANMERGDGENQSIINMIAQMQADFSIDERRIFIGGHSGGAAMAALMMATWPDVFAGGAVIAGIPYDCTRNFTDVSRCLNPGLPRDPATWGDLVRDAFPGFMGRYPKVSVWQGTADFTVNVANGVEMVEQWTNVHGLDQTPSETQMVDGHSRKVYRAGDEVVVEFYEVQGGNHGTFVDPESGCGVAGAFFIDHDICAARRIAEFWGLDAEAPAPGDRAAPTVSITAPADGATVSGMVALAVEAADDVGVTQVDYFANGAPIGSSEAAPFGATWDASAAVAGDYTLAAVARDAAGNEGRAEIAITVDSAVVDETPPTVSITSPSEGAQVSGMVRIVAEASDDNSLAKVEFLVDGAELGEVTSAPYEITWPATEGAHTLTAKAVDAAGNEASAQVSVTGSGVELPEVPVVRFTAPEPGVEVGGVLRITIEATSALAVNQAVLFWQTEDMGPQAIGTDRAPPFEFFWDVDLVPEGPQTLVARAFDEAGGLGEATLEVIVKRGASPPDEPAPGADGGVPGRRQEPEQRRAGREYWGCAGTDAPGSPLILFFLLALGGLPRRRTGVRS